MLVLPYVTKIMDFTFEITLVYTVEVFKCNSGKAGKEMKKIILWTATGIVAALLVVFLIINSKAKTIFASGTIINGMDVSGMTKEELEHQIQDYSLILTYRNEQGEKASETIEGTAFHMTLGENTDASSKVLKEQGIWTYIAGKGKKYQLDNLIQYDETKLNSVVEQLACFDAERFTEPEDAYISEYSETDGYQIIEETAGNIIDEEKARTLIFEAVHSMERRVDLSEQDCYKKAAVTSEDKRLNETLEQLNTYVGARITYRFDSKKEILDGKTISQWLKINRKGKAVIQKEKVKEYVANLRRKYDTIFGSRKFKTSYGKTVTVVGGDYGWWMNYQKEEKELYKLIKAGKKTQRTPEYYQTAQSYGKKDYGNSYIEINLTTQHVFLYIKGKKILETDCVTGNSSRGYDTPEGTYGITYTERNATLNGENYSTPVKYWMPFNRNIGLHDASWRSSFGGEIYKYNGSHGCVNLPSDKAKKLFQYVKAGMPVICYKYSPKKNTNTVKNKTNQAKPVSASNDNVSRKSNTAKKSNSKKNSSVNSNTTKKNNSSAKSNSSTKKNNSATKSNSSTKKNNSATKSNSSTKKNNSVTKSNNSNTKKKNSPASNNNGAKKNKSSAKKNNKTKNNSTEKSKQKTNKSSE